MDYGRLNRRELQALCKEHGIPANKTNAYMAEALGTLVNTPKESDHSLQSVPDPADVVKEKAKRTSKSKLMTDVLEASEVDDLSSQLAKSTIVAGSSGLGPFEEVLTQDPSELRQESEIVVEAGKTRRRARTHTSKANAKSINSLVDSVPPLMETTLEVVLRVEDSADFFAQAVPDFAPEPLSEVHEKIVPTSVYSRRETGEKVHDKSDVAAPELSAAIEESIPNSEEDFTPRENSVPNEDIAVEETTVAATPVMKKSKVKGKRSKKVKHVSPISVQILEDESPPAANEIVSAATQQFPDSPMLGITSGRQDVSLRAVSLSPAPEDGAFEFKPVPASFEEIMTPGKPLVEAINGCQHRLGRKPSKSCESCISEKKADSPLQEALTTMQTMIHNTPVKQGDDKENSLKSIDFESCSVRKLKKEVKRRGLAKRNTTRSVGAEIVQQ